MANEVSEAYLLRTRIFDQKKIAKTYELGAVFRTFSEVDLYQIIRIEEQLRHKKFVGNIDSNTLLSIFKNQNVFSIFFKEYKVYQQIHD